MIRQIAEHGMKILPTSVLCVFVVTRPTVAQLPEMHIGRWQVTSKNEVISTPTPLLPNTTTQIICVDETDKPPIATERTCRMTNYQKQGSVATWSMECIGQAPMIGDGRIEFRGSQYSGSLEMFTKPPGAAPITVRVEYSGKWLGRC